MVLFHLKCETCSAQLSVRSMSAIGQILECPRCSSMVQVQPPPNWTPPEAPPASDSREETNAENSAENTAGEGARDASGPAPARQDPPTRQDSQESAPGSDQQQPDSPAKEKRPARGAGGPREQPATNGERPPRRWFGRNRNVEQASEEPAKREPSVSSSADLIKMADAGFDLEDPADGYESTIVEPLFPEEKPQDKRGAKRVGALAAAIFSHSPPAEANGDDADSANSDAVDDVETAVDGGTSGWASPTELLRTSGC